MRKRNKTLAQNAGVYGMIVVVLGLNAYFWGTHVSKRRGEVDGLKKQIASLEEDRKRREKELDTAEEKAAQYQLEISKRRKELEGYGDFLPSLALRPEVQKFILQTVEELGIYIEKTDEIKLTPRAHYSKLDVRLSLKGTYRDFKLLLNRIYKSERFIRITEFKILSLDDKEHRQSVNMAFETYFSNADRG